MIAAVAPGFVEPHLRRPSRSVLRGRYLWPTERLRPKICSQKEDEGRAGEDAVDDSRREHKDHENDGDDAVEDSEHEAPHPVAENAYGTDDADDPEQAAQHHHLGEVFLEVGNVEREVLPDRAQIHSEREKRDQGEEHSKLHDGTVSEHQDGSSTVSTDQVPHAQSLPALCVESVNVTVGWSEQPRARSIRNIAAVVDSVVCPSPNEVRRRISFPKRLNIWHGLLEPIHATGTVVSACSWAGSTEATLP